MPMNTILHGLFRVITATAHHPQQFLELFLDSEYELQKNPLLGSYWRADSPRGE